MSETPAAPSHCIVLLCDEGYLLPTLVCAKQARQHAPSDVEVIIFLDAPPMDPERQAKLEAISGAVIRPVPHDLTEMLDRRIPAGVFAHTHLSRACMFRLFVATLLDRHYDRILYLDGDIQVRRSLAPLFETPLPEGTVGAVTDWQAIHTAEGMPGGEVSRAYLTAIGLSPAQWGKYFNSGVMMASSETWASIAFDALDFLIAHHEVCRYHDQSALNFVCRDRITTLSPRWNYLRQYLPLSAYHAIDPAIVHFVGKLKPWDGAYAPWRATEYQPYVEMAALCEGLSVHLRRKPILSRLAYKVRPLIVRDDYEDAAYRQRLDDILRGLAGLSPSAPLATTVR